jgi:hypothetical protein
MRTAYGGVIGGGAILHQLRSRSVTGARTMTMTGDTDDGRRHEMTGRGSERRQGRAAILAADTESGLPDRLSWPAAVAVIGTVSLSLWGLIGLGVTWLIG